MTIEQRLQAVERRNRVLTVALVALLVVMAGMAAMPGGVNDEVRARAFVLVDEAGDVHGDWRSLHGGAAFRLFDPTGTVRVRLWQDSSATGLFLQDRTEQARVGLAHFAHGGSGVALHGPGGTTTAVLYMRNDNGSLTFYDSTGTAVHRVAPTQ